MTDLGHALMSICRPDGETARLAVLIGTLENARTRILQMQERGSDPARIGEVGLEEFRKVFAAEDLYRKARGF